MFPLFDVLERVIPLEWASLREAPLVLIGVAFLLAGRIRCPRCGTKVKPPGIGGNPGTLIFLWMVRQKCSKCGELLDW